MEFREGSVRQLVSAVEQAGEALIFLGAGSSTEGYQDEGPFPDFQALVRRVLDDEGLLPVDDEMEAFLQVMRRWEGETALSVRLSNYLHGTPGIAHFQIASMTMSLFPDVNMTVYLTTNFDDLMQKALSAVARAEPRRDPKAFSLSRNSAARDISRTFSAIGGHARKGVPVIVKLFGDLASHSPIFDPADMPFDQLTEQKLGELLDRPILFIGCSLRDAPVLRLLVRSASSHPIFVVSPAAPEQGLLPRLAQRNFYWIARTFSAFISEFIDARRSNRPGFDADIARFLCLADSAPLLSSPRALRDLAATASAAAAARYRSRSRHGQDGADSVAPVARPRTGPDFPAFARSTSRILAVVGESGSGKSTLLHSIYESGCASSEDIYFYYDAQSLQSCGSVEQRLSVDLLTERPRLRTVLRTLSVGLAARGATLFVLVDAINESLSVEPVSLRYEIEALAQEAPNNVKFLYSCRRVLWDNRIAAANDLLVPLYHEHKPFILGRFASEEAEQAYEAHRAAFALKSSYASMSPAAKEHVRDPLMLRFVCEAYRGLALPSFAPAVLVFQRVMEGLRRKYRRTPLIDYLERLADKRLADLGHDPAVGDVFTYVEARADPVLALLAQQQLMPGRGVEHPLTILEDENVIVPLDQSERHFKFTYERFYEFLLGLRLNYRLFTATRQPFEEALAPLLGQYRESHYSFYQALRSAFVIEYLTSTSSARRDAIARLIFHSNADVALFAREVLREVIFEADEDALAVLVGLTGTETRGLAVLLDLGFESEAVAPYAIAALFEEDEQIRRSAAACLVAHARTFQSLDQLDDLFSSGLRRADVPPERKAAAIVYFTAILLGGSNEVSLGLTAARALLDSEACGQDAACTRSGLAAAFAQALANEGPLFFGANYDAAGVLAPWLDRSPEITSRASRIAGLLRDPSPRRLEQHVEDLLFFSRIDARRGGQGIELAARQIDYRVVQWLMIRGWAEDGEAMLGLLDRLVAAGTAFEADFALGIVEQAILGGAPPAPALLDAGLERMAAWTDRFESAPEFYLALTAPDPFTFNLAPLVMLARVQAHFSTPSGASVPILTEWLSEAAEPRRRMALLAANWLAPEFPAKVLAALEPVAADPALADWVDRVLAGLEGHAPRLLGDFLERTRMPMRRREAIRHLAPLVGRSRVQHRPDTLLTWLFLGPQERLDRVADLYELMYRTSSCAAFCAQVLEGVESAQ